MKKRLILWASLLGFGSAGAAAGDAVFSFIGAQRRDVALQMLEIALDGTPRTVLAWKATQPMPLASSMKIVVLAAYARAVAADTLDPQQPVTLSEWESYYLPGLDGGAHAASLKALGIPATRSGRAKEGQQTAPLDTPLPAS